MTARVYVNLPEGNGICRKQETMVIQQEILEKNWEKAIGT